MYIVSILDTGDHPDSIISKIREVVNSCLKTDPESPRDLKERLASHLSQPTMMIPDTYRFWVWKNGLRIEETSGDYFIHILTRFGDRNQKVVIRALRRKESLQEICLDVISESMKSGEEKEIKGLGLPKCLEDNLCEMMKKKGSPVKLVVW